MFSSPAIVVARGDYLLVLCTCCLFKGLLNVLWTSGLKHSFLLTHCYWGGFVLFVQCYIYVYVWRKSQHLLSLINSFLLPWRPERFSLLLYGDLYWSRCSVRPLSSFILSLFLLRCSRPNLVVGIRSGLPQNGACLCSVLLLLRSFCLVLVGHPSPVHLTTYNIAELGKQTCLWSLLFLVWRVGRSI